MAVASSICFGQVVWRLP